MYNEAGEEIRAVDGAFPMIGQAVRTESIGEVFIKERPGAGEGVFDAADVLERYDVTFFTDAEWKGGSGTDFQSEVTLFMGNRDCSADHDSNDGKCGLKITLGLWAESYRHAFQDLSKEGKCRRLPGGGEQLEERS